MNCYIALTRAMHAVLYKHYLAGRFVKIGDAKNDYGPTDRATGAEYKCLGEQERGKVRCSKDYEPGPFYPENVFVTGTDEECDPLGFELLEEFCKKFGRSATRRVILPQGTTGGEIQWQHALMYSPVEAQPQWYKLDEVLRRQFPEAEVMKYDHRIDMNEVEL